VTFNDVRRVALALPEAEEKRRTAPKRLAATLEDR
jgi:hypothetical protein